MKDDEYKLILKGITNILERITDLESKITSYDLLFEELETLFVPQPNEHIITFPKELYREIAKHCDTGFDFMGIA